MNLKSAKAIATLLITLGGTRFGQVREVVSPLFSVLDEFASQGQEIVYGELFKDIDEWIIRVEGGSPREGDHVVLDHSAIEVPEELNPAYTYDCVGLYGDTPTGTCVTILAVGEVVGSDEGSEEPPTPALGIDAIKSHALAMAQAIVENPYEDTSFSDRIHEYGQDCDKEMLCGIRPRDNQWGKFNAHAKTWAKAGEDCKEGLRWLAMNSTGHPYAEAVQLRVKAGHMKVEDI